MNEVIYTSKESVNSCFCVGRQGKEPMCPCRMRAIREDLAKLKVILKEEELLFSDRIA